MADLKKGLLGFLNIKEAVLWHPESAGEKITVRRSWIGRLLKPSAFATLGEAMRDGIVWGDIDNG